MAASTDTDSIAIKIETERVDTQPIIDRINNVNKRSGQTMDQITGRPYKKQRVDTSTPSPSSSTDSQSMDKCPLCGRNLNSLSMDTRSIHINSCLDLQSGSKSLSDSNRNHKSNVINTPQTTSSSTTSNRSRRYFKRRKVQRNGLRQYFAAKKSVDSKIKDHQPLNDYNNGFGSSSRDRISAKEHYLRFKVIYGTNIVVDGFIGWNRYAPQNAVHFLSHFHYDHYQGLGAGYFSGGLIYCSSITARLIEIRLGVDPQCIRSLSMFTKHSIEGSVPPTFVTMMDANHCPGAVMMLFEVHNVGGGVSLHLHLGDARCEMESDSLFHRNNEPLLSSICGQIDRLYLDSTYCSTKKVLPRQSDAVQFIANRCQSLLDDGDDLVILIGTYSIGKERILHRVATQCQCPLFIDSSKRILFRAIYGAEDPLNGGIFTVDEDATKIKVVSMRDIEFSTMQKFRKNEKTKVIGFKPTGWTSNDGNGRRGSDQHIISPRYWSKSGSMVIYDVPYSEHSSFPELCKFLSLIRPKQVVPTVNNWSRSGIQQQIQSLQDGMESFAVNGYRYLPLVEDNGLKQTMITQFISTSTQKQKSCGDLLFEKK